MDYKIEVQLLEVMRMQRERYDIEFSPPMYGLYADDTHRFLKRCRLVPTPTLSALRFSNLLCQFDQKKSHSDVTPWIMSPEADQPPPRSDATESTVWFTSSIFFARSTR